MKKIIRLMVRPGGDAKKPREIGCVRRTIADMESDGVYFGEDARRHFEDIRARTTCHYSGLPSVASYE